MPKQLAFLSAPRFHEARHPTEPCEVFYGGAGGGGKTVAILAAACLFAHRPDFSGIIIRRNRQDMLQPGGILDLAHKWLRPTDAVWSEKLFQYTFPAGGVLKFAYLRGQDDIKQFEGPSYNFIGFDEVTQFEEEDMYTHLFSRLRRLQGVDFPAWVVSASNPGGDGEFWVMNRFPVEGQETKSEGPYFIHADMWDNYMLDRDSYERALRRQNPTQCERILHGTWGIVAGMAFPEWAPATHLINLEKLNWPKEIPDWWIRYEAMDHGVVNPTSWGLFLLDGDANTILPSIYHSPGDVSEHAAAILGLRKSWWEPRGRPNVCFAPQDIRDRTGLGKDQHGNELNVEYRYRQLGITFATAQRGRPAGYAAIRERMKPSEGRLFPDWHPRAGQPGSPRLFIADHLSDLITAIRLAPVERPGKTHAGNAIAKAWEERRGHATAMARYGLNTWDRNSDEPQQAEPDRRPRRGVSGWPGWTLREELDRAIDEVRRSAQRSNSKTRGRRGRGTVARHQQRRMHPLR